MNEVVICQIEYYKSKAFIGVFFILEKLICFFYFYLKSCYSCCLG